MDFQSGDTRSVLDWMLKIKGVISVQSLDWSRLITSQLPEMKFWAMSLDSLELRTHQEYSKSKERYLVHGIHGGRESCWESALARLEVKVMSKIDIKH